MHDNTLQTECEYEAQWVMAERDRLGLISGNLVPNAVKYTPREG
ncbi:hypothetical protein RYZ20_03940 [Thioclava sp. A2]|nr:hypothetical protein [Thioclava sp. A2]MDV7270048.1 hypothetical protein [Thioclava sp. A2]